MLTVPRSSVLFPAPVDVSHELSVRFPGWGEFFVAFLEEVHHVENLLFELDYLGLEARVVLPPTEGRCGEMLAHLGIRTGDALDRLCGWRAAGWFPAG